MHLSDGRLGACLLLQLQEGKRLGDPGNLRFLRSQGLRPPQGCTCLEEGRRLTAGSLVQQTAVLAVDFLAQSLQQRVL